VGFFPEGHHGQAGTLGSPLPGAGRFLGWLERSGVALVPAAIYEAEGRLVVRCGPQLRLAGRGEDGVAAQVMEALAALLPAPYRGAWGAGQREAGPARAAAPVGRSGARVGEQSRWRGRGA
jgi:hypothetical protein